MTKEQILNRFEEITGQWEGFAFSLTREYARRLKKSECQNLLDMAKTGKYSFRIFKDHGYVLDSEYNQTMIYDRRKNA